jgi:hypothetical protein
MALGLCSTVRMALNRSGEGFDPRNSVSSMFNFHRPEKSGFHCAHVNAIARHRSAVFVFMAVRA